MQFVDYAKIEVQAGNGGAGHVSFRREKFEAKGGPDGGDGGRGGNIVALVDINMATLLDFRYRRKFRANNGREGGKGNKSGRKGKDTIIKIPAGTIIKDSKTGEIIADIKPDSPPVIVANGGRGGRGNTRFKSPTNQTPRKFTSGGEGNFRIIEFELKLIADVGLVGLPNAGKSTLLSRISQAKPKIADYPFTTLVPNLGIVKTDEFKSFVVADIPGVIEGAHFGKGLGLEFLRHIQRTRVLLFLIECTEQDPVQQFDMLRAELGLFDPELIEKPTIVAVSKIDLLNQENKSHLDDLPQDWFRISSVSGENLKLLMHKLSEIVLKENEDGRD